MALITLGLMIPDLIIYSMSDDREDTRQETIETINSSWSGSQLISGPILSLPMNVKGNSHETVELLPAKLDVEASVQSKTLTRGIYEAAVYTGEVAINGYFNFNELDKIAISRDSIRYSDITVTIGIGDLKGLETVSELEIGNQKVELNGGSNLDVYRNIEKYSSSNQIFVSTDDDDFRAVRSAYDRRAYIGESNNGCLQGTVSLTDCTDLTNVPFKLTMKVKGSQSIGFAPIGRENIISVNGDCASPSFGGMFLPSERTVKNDHFDAVWRLNSNNRNYPQAFTTIESESIANSAVLVSMLVPVDGYKMVDRSLKYAFLVIMLTFITILFCELVSKTPLFMFQYMLIGLALILFYSLLLALVEHTSFGLSYIIAAVMTIGMVVAYVQGVIKKSKMSMLVGGVLAIVYGFLYIVMCMETYALLTGSIGLFIALGIVMYVSLKVKQVYAD